MNATEQFMKVWETLSSKERLTILISMPDNLMSLVGPLIKDDIAFLYQSLANIPDSYFDNQIH